MSHIEVFMQGEGSTEVKLVQVPQGGTVHDLLKAARAQGIALGGEEEAAVFVEDADDELDLNVSLQEAGIKKHTHVHVHRCRRIEVSITFNGEIISRKVRPSVRVAVVHLFAVKKFKLSETDATEHVLQLCGTNIRPDDDVHIGTLAACSECAVCFDLVPKKRVEG